MLGGPLMGCTSIPTGWRDDVSSTVLLIGLWLGFELSTERLLNLPTFVLYGRLREVTGKGYITQNTMPRYIVTTKRMTNFNCIRVEPGMSVEIVSNCFTNPLLTNGGQEVVNAFMRIYGIDIRRAGILSTAYLDVQRIG